MAVRSTHEWPEDDPVERPAPTIELGLRAQGADPDEDGDDGHPDTSRRRPIPRRYLVMGAAVLLAVGFVGGLAIQRGTSNDPGTATEASRPSLVYSVPTFGCRWYQGGNGTDPRMVDSTCSGTLRTVGPVAVVLEMPDGVPLGLQVDEHTTVIGAPSIGSLYPGEYVTVRATTGSDGHLHASMILVI